MYRMLLLIALISGGLAGSAPSAAEMTLAQASGCTESCRAQYYQGRIATKGSPSCDAQFAACMRRCISSRAR